MVSDIKVAFPHPSPLAPHAVLKLGRFSLSLEHPLIMGIVNVTPDSFSDGGRFFDSGRALDHARQMLDEGADILDIGGESSRPGSEPIEFDEELRRVLPVLERLVELPAPVSVDTCKPEVMCRAIAAGAAMINDIYALRAQGALDAVAESPVAVCLMHMQGEPRTMQDEPKYDDVVSEVKRFLEERLAVAVDAGIREELVCLDPGIGFGKTVEQNFELVRRLDELVAIGRPMLIGFSRKSSLAAIVGDPRSKVGTMAASVGAAVAAFLRGATILRAHDVREHVEALAAAKAVRG